MARMARRRIIDDSRLAALREPRSDLVLEERIGDDRFVATDGPFDRYNRWLEVDDASEDGSRRVVEHFEYSLPLGVWNVLFAIPVKRALRRPSTGRQPWWAPPDRIDARTARILALVCTLSLLDGFLGTVITQTLTFAADEFGSSDTQQGLVLAGVRIGVLFSVALATLADRKGRRRILMWSMLGATVLTVLGAFAPTLLSLGLSQAAARGFTNALGILLIVIAAEEMPPRSRAYGFSLIALTAALGAGFAVMMLPVADFDIRAWRLIYFAPALALPLLIPICRRVPETARFADTMTKVEPMRIDRRRLVVLASIGFLLAMFATPASQFQNEFLKDDRGFSALTITIFTLITATPAGIGVFAGGIAADVKGRRRVAAIGAIGGAVLMAMAYRSTGSPLWVLTMAGTIVGALVVPALGVYGPELFGTERRASANSYIKVVTVAGGAIGVAAVGWMSDTLGGFGNAFTVMLVAPALVAAIVLTQLPETSGKTLEELNPVAPEG